MFVNIIQSYRNIVAICDSEIVGKTFEEGNFKLETKESFFKGEKKEPEEVEKILKEMVLEDATFNIVGKNSTSLAIKSGIIEEEKIKKITGIPYALKLL